MNSRKNIGIVVTVLGALATCCVCPLVVNNLYFIATTQSIYGQVFSSRIGKLTAASYVAAAQNVCIGVLALVVLIIGIVVLVQAKGNGAPAQPGGDVQSS